MDKTFISIVKKLIDEQGKEALLNPAKCKAFLSDYTHNEYKKECRLLQQALDADVTNAINTTTELAICKKQQIHELVDKYFLSQETASDLVDTLAFVLRGDTNKTQMFDHEKAYTGSQKAHVSPPPFRIYRNRLNPIEKIIVCIVIIFLAILGSVALYHKITIFDFLGLFKQPEMVNVIEVSEGWTKIINAYSEKGYIDNDRLLY
jgi:hypothetical protein